MKKSNTTDIQLVITVALSREIPQAWLESFRIPVYTLDSLKSGALNEKGHSERGIIVITTGLGPEASEDAAHWIKNQLTPLFVVNMGTCGLIGKKYPLHSWIIAGDVSNERSERISIDRRLPFPHPDSYKEINSLISVKEAVLGELPESWQQHDAVDMECYAQAKVFRDTQISFHCLKFSSDYSDSNALLDFNANVRIFREEFKKLLSFVASPGPTLLKRDAPPMRDSKDNFKTAISVIIPVYNRESTIRNAIDSVLSQSYAPDQIIVVDDGSTDGTKEALESYGNELNCIFLSHNSGPSRARNEGVRHACNQLIAFLDSDDRWEKNKLKHQLAYFDKYPHYQILQSEEKWIRNNETVNPCKHHKKPVGWIWKPSLERCLVSPSGVLFKKSLFEKVGGFDESLPVCEDYDLWLRISRHCPVGLESSFSIIKYGGHKNQLSSKYPAMDRFRIKSLLKLLEKESQPDFRQEIIYVLTKKLQILIMGSEKRQKKKEAQEYREILATINPMALSGWEAPTKHKEQL